MISISSRLFVRPAARNAILGLTALGCMGLAGSLRAQSDNFNSGVLSTAWQHYDSGLIIDGAFGDPSFLASYTLPADGSGGYAFRIDVPGDAQWEPYGVGPARALAFRVDVPYATRFSVGSDILAWNNGIDQAFGPFWFIGNPGPGTTTGYTLTWEATDFHVRISRIDGEAPTTIATLPNLVLDPTQRYRFVASSHDGSTFLGQIFRVGDLANPVAGVIGNDGTYTGGLMGLLCYDGGTPSVTGADVTYDNYSASAPATGTLRPTVAHLYPAPLQQAPDIYPTITVAILDRDTQTDPSSVLLWLDGALIPVNSVTIVPSITEANNPGGYQQVFGGVTASYAPSNLLRWNTLHTNSIAFRDSMGVWMTNTWTWTSAYPMLHATNSLPLGSFSLPGWDVRMVMTNGPALPNSLATAEQQLAIPPQIPFIQTTQIVSQVLNWNDTGDGVNAQPFGYFSDPSLVSGLPGLPPTGPAVQHDNVACEMFAYLQLSAGLNRFGVVSDDGFQLSSGYGLHDTNAAVLGSMNGGTFNGTFDFVVEAAGLYPVHGIYYQSGGYADFQLFSVDLNDPTDRVLINDPNAPLGVVPAFLPVRLLSASSVSGPYATAAGAVIDTVGQTVTVPMAGAAQYYQMQTLNPVRLTSITASGGKVVIHYQ